MIQLSSSIASSGSGPYANIINWIDWENLYTSLDPNDSVDISVPLSCNSILTFTITNTILSGQGYSMCPRLLSEINPPSSIAFGTYGYTGLTGHIGLETCNEYINEGDASRLILSNINVTQASKCGCINNYMLVLSNIETATTKNPLSESQIYTTDKNPWSLLTWLGDKTTPIVSGVNSNTILTTGPNIGTIPSSITDGAPVFSTQSPSKIIIDIASDISSQALALGIAILPCVTRGINLFK